MGSSNSKARCLFLPAQSGKTRKVEEEIIELKRLCGISGSRSIDIFISANNRLLVYQTSARLRRDLGTPADTDESAESDSEADAASDVSDDEASDAVIKGRIFSWTHGKTTGIAPDALADKILLEEIEMVFMCANKRRFTYLAAMLDRLTTHRMFRRDPAQIYIWIDEADSSMSLWRQFEAAATENPAITQITLVSATFGRILKKYERLRIVPYEHTHPDCYRRLIDCRQEVIECGLRDPCQFVLSVLSTHAEIMANGTCVFVPGAYTKESHYEIAEELQKLDFAVVIINGECKELRIPGEATIDLREYLSCPDPEMLPEEFNQTLAELYATHKLWRFPFAITGYLCIQRGVTFQCAPAPGRHDGFVFTHGIIPPIRDKAEAYQTMARMFGNTGGFPNYVRPIIYTDEKTFAGVCDQEETAVNLPRMVFMDGLEDANTADFKRAAGSYTPTQITDPNTYRIVRGASEDETIAMARQIAKLLGHRFNLQAPNEDGKIQTTLNKAPRVHTVAEVVRSVPGAYGYKLKDGMRSKSYRYGIPGYMGDCLYIVIPLIDPAITAEQKTVIDSTYAKYLFSLSGDTISHV